MDGCQKFDEAVALVRRFAPEYTLSLKSGSKLHKAIGWVLSKTGNDQYVKGYWTTLGANTARPTVCDKGPMDGEWGVILHEGRHVLDFKINPWKFVLLYLLPQLLGILGIILVLPILIMLMLGASAWVLLGFLLFLFLLPIPSPGRAYIEARAFTVSLLVDYWSGNIENEETYIKAISSLFCDGSYYYMWPVRSMVEWYFTNKLIQIKEGTLSLDPYLEECKKLALATKSVSPSLQS